MNLYILTFFFLFLQKISAVFLEEKNSQGFLAFSENGLAFSSDFSDYYETYKIITVSRHGTATHVGKPFVAGEYLPYGISDQDFFKHELLTPLGGGQCWSIGRNLAKKYPDLINEDIFNKKLAQFHIYPEQKTIKCAHYLEDGVRGLITKIGEYNDDIVGTAFRRHANCPMCFSDTAFPFKKSQHIFYSDSQFDDLSDSQIHHIDSMFSDHSQVFLDWYADCTGIQGIIAYKSCKGLTLSDRKKLFIDPSDEVYIGGHTLYGASKHFYHNLPNFGLSKFAVNMLKNNEWDFAPGDMNAFLEQTIMISYVHGLALVKRIHKQVTNGKTWVGYFVHNNNMAGLLVLLMGKDRDEESYYPYYASTVELVFKRNSDGDIIVNLIKDNQKQLLKGCKFNCPLSDFKNLLVEVLAEEDSAVAFCSR